MRVSRMLGRVVVAVAATTALAACSTGSGQSGTADESGQSGQSGDGTISLVASTNVWGDVASQVAGDAVSVTSIISDPDTDPHEYQADARTQLALSDATVVVENGGGYDDFVDTMLSAAKSEATVINAVDVSGFAATQGDELNEHVWYDYPTVIKVAGAIEEALSKADPDNASTFESNLATFTTKVEGLEKAAAEVKSAHAGAGVAITEPVPLYLLEAMGLDNKTPEAFSEAIEEETDVPATVLDETLKLFSDHQVDALVYNEQTTGPQTEAVLSAAKDADIPVVPVQETLPAGLDYVSWQQKIIDEISAALSK
ncbi:metal ABC transporter solute-binding protein, Zn/Mn family [Actinomyces polynesiensis]|uniref:metal ABC transporter solute-binding protein, Zn/Mn family n=1 Tax=Actinomyces polynesiensis TaxID=1325934 RepID=UPI0018CE463A|nr:zinc ABC transporter substrate-binding protein [Actinomyces polynesiensis]